MKNPKKSTSKQASAAPPDLFALKPGAEHTEATDPTVHVLSKGIICRTEIRARKRNTLRIVLEATEGFIPLWEENLVLRWTFDEASLAGFQNPKAIKDKTRELFATAIAAWGDAAPIRFTENDDNSDFQMVVEQHDDCTPQGCTLAQAFFPDAGRHDLYIFPKMFGQNDHEQIDTLTHELGHVFGLRHFFALEAEKDSPAEVFGEHKAFSIMNYGKNSELTPADRNDLKRLYQDAWSKTLTKINGTPIKFVRPYHYFHT